MTLIMNPLVSFLAASGLAALDLGILALATRRLGAKPGKAELIALALGLFFKLALLVVGVAWLTKQGWIDKRAMLAGLLAPFVLFIVWQALRLQLRARKRA